jgi:hypothetical protein
MIATILMCWAIIWTVRNDFSFNNIQPQVQRAKEIFRKEVNLLTLRAKAKDSLIMDPKSVVILRVSFIFFLSFFVS